MEDILSQSEIDNLLSTLVSNSSVEEITSEDTTDAELDIKDFDFEKPPKFNNMIRLKKALSKRFKNENDNRLK